MTTDRRRQATLWEAEGFAITEHGLRVTGQPSLTSWGNGLRRIAATKSGMQWGIGDMMLYADERGWSPEDVETVLDQTGLKRGTLMNLKSVSRAFPFPRRKPGLPWSHHALVCSLSEEEADALLEQSAEHAWGWEELREHARTARNQRARVEQVFPEGTYGLLVASPPWRSGGRRRVMDTDEIAALAPRVQAVTAPSATLYLRATNVQLDDAISVLKAWGFTLRGAHVLISQTTRFETEFMRERHEIVLVGTRGRVPGPERKPDSVLAIEQERLVEVMAHAYPGVPKVLLFAEDEVDGWATWQHDLREQTAPSRTIVERQEEENPA
jgi:N6-adenosine-specific RNA methylase IME4